MPDAVYAIALSGLAAAAALCVVRLVRGPSLADRVVSLDLLLVFIVSGLAIRAGHSDEGTYLDAMVVAALLGFVGTTTVARFIEKRGTARS